MDIDEVLNKFKEKFGVEISKDKQGYYWTKIEKDKLIEALKYLKEHGFTQLVTITGIDRPKNGVIELVYHLSFESEPFGLLNISTEVPRDNPVIKTSYFVYNSAYIYEREVYDLVGVKFEGHPELKRLFLPEDIPEGIHPLRKDWKGNIAELKKGGVKK